MSARKASEIIASALAKWPADARKRMAEELKRQKDGVK